MVGKAAVRTSYGSGRVVSGEDDFVFTTSGAVKPGVIFAHQRGASAMSCFNNQETLELFYELAEYYTVLVTDLGGIDGWGNATTQSRITAGRNFLSSKYGVTGKTGLVGISMGGPATFTYAKNNPSLTAFVCNIVPAVHIADVRNYNGTSDTNQGSAGTYASVIDTAYGATWSDTTHGVDYSPHVYRLSYPDHLVRTAVWSTPADTVCRPQFHETFRADNPLSELYQVRNTSGVGPHHNSSIMPSVRGNPSGQYYFPKPADWCAERRKDSF